MIGQKTIQAKFGTMQTNNAVPRFMIITGARGSGKKTLSKQIAQQLNARLIQIDIKVDAIRAMIEQSYKVGETTVFLIADADTMSVIAKNSLLKITEEPPANVYVILTLQDINNTLDTIKSRASVFQMDAYTPSEITRFVGTDANIDLYTDICETPLDVQLLKKYGAKEFYNYVTLVYNNIAKVSGANAFKIANKISFSADDDKYDLQLFWRAFNVICMQNFADKPILNANAIHTTSKYLQELRVQSINKSATFDMWLLEIRQGWM